MSGGAADDEPLDYATIQIIPSENRYEAFVCSGNEVDALSDGILDALLPHLPELREKNAKGSKTGVNLQPPDSSSGTPWFTKSTLSRFFQIVGSPDLTNTMKTMNEMAQLEETKKFQLSSYGQMSKTEEKGDCNLDGLSPKHRCGPEFASSAASKNELLRAVDLRLTALQKDLTASFEKACGATCSSKEFSYLVKFMEHFGATNLKKCTCKYLELNPRSGAVGPVNDDKKRTVTSDMSNENATNINGSFKGEKLNSSTPVKYNVLPAKVAQIERHDSSESEESSNSSDDNEGPIERSRTMARSALPRRSASPMRRVQIGRTGSRRAPAIMIRSLQTRDNMFYQEDAAANSDEEGLEPSSKTADNNVGRISVQDAISLFERKQSNDASDVQKRRSLTNITVGSNKLVLRRWSTSMGDASKKYQPELVTDESDPISHDFTEDVLKSKITKEEVGSNDLTLIDKTCTTAKVDVRLEDAETIAVDPPETLADSPVSEPSEVVQKLSAHSEWSRRKEEELDQMLKKVMESKHVAQNNSLAYRKKDVYSEQRGELYDQYKAKRDEKRRVDEAKVHTNKEVKTKGMRQVADDRRSKIASAANVTKKRVTRKPEVPSTNLSKSEKPKKEISKPSMLEKISSRAKPTAAARKSWPSSASDRTTGISPASVNPSHQKAKPVPSFNRSSAKTERSPMLKKNVKETNDIARDSRRVNEKKEIVQTKTGKITKTKVTPSRDTSSIPVKSSIRDKVTKKSSIVPLESKSFHKGSRNSLDNSSPVVNRTKSSKLSKSADSSMSSKKSTRDHEVEVTIPDLASQPDKGGGALLPDLCDSEVVMNNQQDSEMQTLDVVDAEHGDDLIFPNEEKSSVEVVVEEESMTTPKFTEEIEEFQEIPTNNDDDPPQIASLENVAPIENPRARLSLSQMLQEENSEPDNIDWGIAENPPMMNSQRGTTKGFKRLLKFARKSKGEANLAGWSSPSVVSEGEDDSEESKSLNTKKADNLLMKATLNSGLVRASLNKSFDSEKLCSGTNHAQNFSSKFQESLEHATVSSTKGATNKKNEPKAAYILGWQWILLP